MNKRGLEIITIERKSRLLYSHMANRECDDGNDKLAISNASLANFQASSFRSSKSYVSER